MLVHIAAPCARRDDNRYEAQAASLMSFVPVRRTKVWPADESDFQDLEDIGVDRLKGHDRSEGTLLEDESGPGLSKARSTASPVVSTQYLTPSQGQESSSHDGRYHCSSSSTALRAARSFGLTPTLLPHQSRPVNPPYSNPFRQSRKPVSEILELRTPYEPRPRTAPAVPPSHNRPVVRANKRAHSESSSFESLASVVPDSQTGRSSSSGEQLRKRRRLQLPDGGSLDQAEVVFDGVLDFEPSSPCPKTKTQAVEASGEESSSHRGKASGVFGYSTRYRVEAGDLTQTPTRRCFFPLNRDYDFDSSVNYSSSTQTSKASNSTESTESPSQPRSRAPSCPETPSTAPEHIDLTTPSHTSSSPRSRHLSVRDHSTGQASMASTHPVEDQSRSLVPVVPSSFTMHGVTSPVFPAIQSLPTTIFPPPPTASPSSSVLDTQPPQTLARLVSELPIPRFFRPASVSRNVSSSERGCWLLNVTIARDQDVATRRKEMKVIRTFNSKLHLHKGHERELEMSEAKLGPELWHFVQEAKKRTSPVSESLTCKLETDLPLPQNLWTETEFLTFYSRLRHRISLGLLGWSTRVFLEIDRSPNTNHLSLTLKTTCFAYLIPHIYLTLYVFSDRQTAETDMEWRAADEAVVVSMAGGGMNREDKTKEWEEGLGWGRIIEEEEDDDDDSKTRGNNETTKDKKPRKKESWGLIPTSLPVLLDD